MEPTVTENKKKSILFICTHNSSRSQMAEGIVNALYGSRFAASSAGTLPTRVNPFAIEAMKEIGIDISTHHSKSVQEFLGRNFDFVVTVCDIAKQTCPVFPGGAKYLRKSFEDPTQAGGSEKEKLAVFRKVRSEIEQWLEKSFGPDKD